MVSTKVIQRARVAFAGLVALLATLFVPFAVPAAQAQTGYPPGPCTATVSASALGSATVGSTITLTLQPTCVWTPNSQVQVTVNGESVGTKIANANGFVTVSITVLDDETLSVDDPVIVPAICGTNTVIGRGTSTVASGNVVTHQATFTLVCEDEDEDEDGDRDKDKDKVPVAKRLAFTGSNFETLLALGLVLVVGGATVVVAARRRKPPSIPA